MIIPNIWKNTSHVPNHQPDKISEHHRSAPPINHGLLSVPGPAACFPSCACPPMAEFRIQLTRNTIGQADAQGNPVGNLQFRVQPFLRHGQRGQGKSLAFQAWLTPGKLPILRASPSTGTGFQSIEIVENCDYLTKIHQTRLDDTVTPPYKKGWKTIDPCNIKEVLCVRIGSFTSMILKCCRDQSTGQVLTWWLGFAQEDLHLHSAFGTKQLCPAELCLSTVVDCARNKWTLWLETGEKPQFMVFMIYSSVYSGWKREYRMSLKSIHQFIKKYIGLMFWQWCVVMQHAPSFIERYCWYTVMTKSRLPTYHPRKCSL